jgi:hypothetical protein
MPANAKVAWKLKAAASVVAIVMGFIFPMVFFAFNDPDKVKFNAVVSWFAIYFIPTALFISMRHRATFYMNAIVTLAGVFVGTCVAIIYYYPDKANLFPIVAAIWTVVAAIPIACGSAIGFLLVRLFYRKQ